MGVEMPAQGAWCLRLLNDKEEWAAVVKSKCLLRGLVPETHRPHKGTGRSWSSKCLLRGLVPETGRQPQLRAHSGVSKCLLRGLVPETTRSLHLSRFPHRAAAAMRATSERFSAVVPATIPPSVGMFEAYT